MKCVNKNCRIKEDYEPFCEDNRMCADFIPESAQTAGESSGRLVGSVSLAELEQFALEMGIDESECLAGDNGVGFAFGFANAVAQLTAFIQRKKQNV